MRGAFAGTMMLLHNPRCSKSRAAKALLEERGVEFTVREYLKEPLSFDELRILKKKLRREPAEWMRWNEAEVAEAGIAKTDAPLDLLRAIADYPKLMERPILVGEDTAAVGRPGPEALEPMLA